LVEIIKNAFEGQSQEIYTYLEILSSTNNLDCDDPALTFPYKKCAMSGSTNIQVYVVLHPNEASYNRAMHFDVRISDATYILHASLIAESAQEASSWLFVKPCTGYCSDRTKSLAELTSLSKKTLTFSGCP
ncbi:hypothetical protein, partial [Gluconobacter sp.]|uniref:hypothetical protein n=1 Tax=Gluconobacter sp. TaxID=1876758 RepID=UPI0039E72F1D